MVGGDRVGIENKNKLEFQGLTRNAGKREVIEKE
jgi:hypothetical protein